MKISGNEVRPGMIILHKDKLWRAVKTQHTQPGKGGAYLQVELKNLQDNSKLNERFRSSEAVEKVSLEQRSFQYLYKEGNSFIFMDQNNYEQISLGTDVLEEEQIPFLTENLEITINFYEDKAISLELPAHMEFEVTDTEAVIKGQTASSSFKPAILSNGVKTAVPTHIQVGMKIIINTTDLSYVGKAK
ncbi:elongation factor P [Rickettsiales bacterium LUAb2]